jgi:hypothetical protein
MFKIPFSKSAHKEMAHLMRHPAVEASVADSRWSAFGRTDLVVQEGYPDEKLFFIDGTAVTLMYRFNGEIKSLDRHEFMHFSGYFPFELLPQKEKEEIASNTSFHDQKNVTKIYS